jgi:hypothetical protein
MSLPSLYITAFLSFICPAQGKMENGKYNNVEDYSHSGFDAM